MDRRSLSILMVSDFYPPHLGGVERVVADLGAELAARGHRVRVATLWNKGLAQRERDGVVEVHRLQSTAGHLPFLHANAGRPFHPPLADPLVTQQLRGLISWYRPDIVHGHTWMMCSALPLKREFGFAAVATLHDHALLCPKKTLVYRDESTCQVQLSRYCARCAASQYGMAKGLVTSAGLAFGRGSYRDVDFFTAISTYVAEQHSREHFIERTRMAIIPNFVRDDLLQSPRRPPLSDLPSEYMLFVGALGTHKGIAVLLEAYAHLHTSVPLVLIGLPQVDTPLISQENVIVRPGLSHAEVICAMDHCRFLITPSIGPEGFGMVAIEAMARGKAVIASALGGLLDIVQHQLTGLLVPPGDAVALADAMETLLKSPEQAAIFGRNGSSRCLTAFNAGIVVEAIENVYRKVCERRGQSWIPRVGTHGTSGSDLGTDQIP